MAKMTMGVFLAVLRRANGMTQQEVADRLNVSNKAVSRWERDECAPDLSLIPAIAELFNVTCDELLRGERIQTVGTSGEKARDPQVEKQRKVFLKRTLSSFRTRIWIALGLAFAGLILMLGITFGFGRTVIGLMVSLLFNGSSVILTGIAFGHAREEKYENELYDGADEKQKKNYDKTVGNGSFAAFYSVLVSLLLSLMTLMIRYFSANASPFPSITAILLLCVFTVLFLLWIFFHFRKPYLFFSANGKLPEKQEDPVRHELLKMNVTELGLLFLVFLLMLFAPCAVRNPGDVLLPGILAGLTVLFLLGIIAFFVWCLIKQKENRKRFLLPGIRNLVLIVPTCFFGNVNDVGWTRIAEDGKLIRESSWNFEIFCFAAAVWIIVFLLFSVIQAILEYYGK